MSASYRRWIFLALFVPGCESLPEMKFNTPPTGGAVAWTPESPGTLDSIEAILTEEPTDPEGDELSLTWTFYRNGAVFAVTGSTVDSLTTTRGGSWTVSVVAADQEFQGEPFVDSVSIVNTPPSLLALRLTPAAPVHGDNLLLEVESFDPDGDAVYYDTSWTRNGVPESAWDDQMTIDGGSTRKDDVWEVTVTPADDFEQGEPLTASTTILNAPPSLASLVLAPLEPNVRSSVTATALEIQDPDSDPVGLSIEWTIDGELVQTDTLSPGETTSTLDLPLTKAQVIQASATPNDGSVDGESVLSGTLTVLNSPPELELVTLSPESGLESTLFECTPGLSSDPDGDPLSFSYTWTVSGVLISSTETTLDGDWFSKYDTLTCRVTASDGESTDTVASNIASVENSPPTFTGVVISPARPDVSSTMVAAASGMSDADGDTGTFAYQWYVNGALASSTSTLRLAEYARGDELYCEMTVSDEESTGTTLSSSVIEILNAAPNFSSASISPSRPTVTDPLEISCAGWFDHDGDPEGYEYSWYVDGALVAEETGSILPSGYFEKSDTVYATVTPYDGYGYGTARTTSTITVQNSLPEAVGVILDELPAASCTELRLDGSDSTDADGDPLDFDWEVSARPAGSHAGDPNFSDTSAIRPTFLADAAGTWILRLTVSDGSSSDSSNVLLETVLRSENEPPSADAGTYERTISKSICAETGYSVICADCEGITYTLDPSASEDPDGDFLSYLWSVTSDVAGPDVTLSDSTAARPTVTFDDMKADYGLVNEYGFTVTLTVWDCVGESSTAIAHIDVSCAGL